MKLAAAPFDTGDVLTVYEVRYKPAIHFCLPITTFSAKQCDAIQCPFYKVMLPKLGINRNMKRDVIYGPYELGGLNLTDLKVEQLAQHIHRLIGNVRKRGNLGIIILMTFNAYQLHIGTAPIPQSGPTSVPPQTTEGYIMHHFHLGRTTSDPRTHPNTRTLAPTQIQRQR